MPTGSFFAVINMIFCGACPAPGAYRQGLPGPGPRGFNRGYAPPRPAVTEWGLPGPGALLPGLPAPDPGNFCTHKSHQKAPAPFGLDPRFTQSDAPKF